MQLSFILWQRIQSCTAKCCTSLLCLVHWMYSSYNKYGSALSNTVQFYPPIVALVCTLLLCSTSIEDIWFGIWLDVWVGISLCSPGPIFFKLWIMTHFMGSKWLIPGVINDFSQWCLIDIILGWRISEDKNSHFKYIFQLFDLKNFPLSNLMSIFFPFDLFNFVFLSYYFRRGCFSRLPVLYSNDLVHGSW